MQLIATLRSLKIDRAKSVTFAVTLLVASTIFTVPQTAAASPPADRPDPRGQEAIDQLAERLADVANAYGLSAPQLKTRFLEDDSLSVDSDGQLFYLDLAFDPELAPSIEPALSEAPPTTDPVFSLHSRPGSNFVIYLDFDGHTTTGTSWNSNYNISTIVSPAYDIDGSPNSWSSTELSRIANTWKIVTEDFAPFDIDVTTEEPPVDRLIKSGGSDSQWGVRVVITDDTWANCDCGGHAYINSFTRSSDTPVFVYNTSLNGVAEASSHEVGHAVGLSHDGTSNTTYYTGHGSGEQSWAPIMGASYYESVTQWSKGEYYNSNNAGSGANYGDGPDDLVIMTTQFGFGYRPDDHGNTAAAATAMSGGSVSANGVIERTSDVDVFRFTTGGGVASFEINPDPFKPNLNIKATLRDSGGNPISTSNPTSTLSASFSQNLSPGTYYIDVEGTGAGSPMSSSPTGYTEYGTLGQYTLSGTVSAPVSTSVASIGDFGDASTAEGNVAALVNSWNVGAVITQGDNRYGSNTFDQTIGQFYCDFVTDVTAGNHCSGGNASINSFFPSLGNHDYDDGGGLSEYLTYFSLPGNLVASSGTSPSERYYDVVIGDVHYFSIDSDRALASSSDMTAQQNWLQAQLAASTSAWQVVFLHHAPYSSANHGSNSGMQWPYASWGADAVIAGHDHTYERIARDGIVYFVNGLGGRSIYSFDSPISGSQVRYNNNYGAMLIDGDATQLTFEFINIQGQSIDTHTLSAGPPPPPPPSGVVDVQISGGSDDVEERASDSVVDTNSTDIELGDDPGFNEGQTVGLLFRNVTVPQGAMITNAYLEFTVDEPDSGTTNLTIRAHDSDNAADFVTSANNVTNRTTTSASAYWSIPSWGSVGAIKQSPNLTALVQEVVDRSGWTSGNKMVFVIDGSGSRTTEAYEGSSSQAARLHIEYDTAPPSGDGLVGLWEFDNNADLLAATIGNDLSLVGSHASTTGVNDDDGAVNVGVGSHYVANHGIPSNGSGSYVNEWSLLIDFKYQALSWISLFQTDTTNVNDGDAFVRSGSGALGVGDTGYSSDLTATETWYRVLFTVDNGDFYRIYVNGSLWLEGYVQSIDGRFSLDPTLLLFADENGEDNVIQVSTVALWDRPLKASKVAGLGVAGTPVTGIPGQPVAGFSHNCTNLECNFTDISTDSDGSVVAWSWNFGDGSSSSDQNPSHTYASAGTYTVDLAATDDDGNSDSISVTISAADGANEIMAWVPSYGDAASRLMADANFGACSPKDGLTRVGLQFWEVNSDGTIGYEQRSYLNLSDSDVAWWTNWGQANGIEILLTVHNHDGNDWNWDLAYSAFGANSSTLVNALVDEVERLGLDGVDLDFEGIGNLEYSRDEFAQFVAELSTELKARGRVLTVDSFRYIWNAPNVSWRSDWVGYVDNIHAMGYEDLYEGSTVNYGGDYYDRYSYHQNLGVAAGYAADATLMGFPGDHSDWGTSTGYGTSASAHLQEVANLAHGSTGIAIWDLQLPAPAWQTSDLWCEIVALKGDPTPPNLAPTPDFTHIEADLTASFTDTSTDNDGFIVGWDWDFGDGNTSTTQNPDHTYASAGTYTVTVEVTDNDGATDSTSRQVTVTEPVPEPPTADFAHSEADLTASFTDTSTDDDGFIVGWDWNFGDGNTSTTQNPDHTFASSGTYTVTLDVTDNDGATDSTSQQVTVTEPVPEPPTAPSNLTATVEKSGKGRNKVIDSVTLNWSDNSVDEIQFVIEGCLEVVTGKGRNRTVTCDYVTVGTVGSDVTSFDVDISRDEDHFRVRAENGVGHSDPTDTVGI